MEIYIADCCAFSNDCEATALTSASSQCSMPGTARLRAIEAALNIPHFTFLVIGSPMMSKRKNLDEKPRKRPASQRPKHGDCSVVPSRRAFSRDWQNRVSDSWS